MINWKNYSGKTKSEIMDTLALATIACGMASLLSLLTLHFTSPEYQPSWRMVSEYAMGKHKWLITSFFLLWGISSLLLSFLLWDIATGIWAKAGIILLVISAIGEIMGGLFDVKHKHHGLAFLLGVPTVPIAALLISYNLAGMEQWFNFRSTLLISAHSTWISLVVMGVAMGVMFSGFKKVGIIMNKDTVLPEKVPDGVIALAGYANRILILCYVGWLIVAAISVG